MATPPIWKVTKTVAASTTCATLLLASSAQADHGNACPKLYEKGTLELDFNPAFLEVDEYDDGEGLTISSFFNAEIAPDGTRSFYERDLVARIPHIACVDFSDPDVEELTDLDPTQPPKTVWPNEAIRVPDGVFPFEALINPQGFLSAGRAGRLTAIDLSTGAEYIIHESTLDFSLPPHTPGNSPRFYHRALFMDMDGDGLDDIVTVRSGFLTGPVTYPPFSELVWFQNPGDDLDANTPWTETVLYGGPTVGFLGPDIALYAHDFENDGVPEIVATHFFTGSAQAPGGPPPMSGKISIYGAPVGMTWGMVNQFVPIRTADISTDQGFPFDVLIVDLDRDGKVDVLATNHQPDGCTFPTSNPVPGRVYALEQPASGNLFEDDWTTHVLLDDIYPQPSLQPVRPPGRLAPGHAKAFAPKRGDLNKPNKRPWIVVGGDEAGKVWILKPRKGPHHAWEYTSSVVFDINDHYGENTTQTVRDEFPVGVTVSTIGSVAVRYDRPGKGGKAEIYIPVFEGREIHVLSFRKGRRKDRVQCVPDVTVECPPAPPGPPGGPGGPPGGPGGPPAGPPQ